MNLLADVVIPGHHFGQVTESAPGSDAFVLITLGLLAFLFGAFAVFACVLWHRERRPAPHRQLLMELEDEQTGPPAPKTTTTGTEDDKDDPPQPWEKKADWWKEP